MSHRLFVMLKYLWVLWQESFIVQPQIILNAIILITQSAQCLMCKWIHSKSGYGSGFLLYFLLVQLFLTYNSLVNSKEQAIYKRVQTPSHIWKSYFKGTLEKHTKKNHEYIFKQAYTRGSTTVSPRLMHLFEVRRLFYFKPSRTSENQFNTSPSTNITKHLPMSNKGVFIGYIGELPYNKQRVGDQPNPNTLSSAGHVSWKV